MLNNIIGLIGSPATGIPITANMTGRWDASNASSLTMSGSKVTQMNDLSGNGRHMVQATSAYQATLTGTKNGLNYMNFGGAQYYVPASTWAQTNLTIFIVVQWLNTTATLACGWSDYQADVQQNVGGNFAWQLGAGANQYIWSDGAQNTNWHYLSMKRPNTGTAPTAKIDGGGSWSLTSGSSFANLVTGKLWMGTRNDLAVPLQGNIGEIIIYSSIMSDTDIALVNAFLAAKWGI